MKPRTPEILEFCDLSHSLDSKLRLMADLTQASDSDRIIFDDSLAAIGDELIEYLDKRILLEHVFFGRSIKRVQLESQKMKAEIWRLQKIKAAHQLKQEKAKPTEKRTAGRN